MHGAFLYVLEAAFLLRFFSLIIHLFEATF